MTYSEGAAAPAPVARSAKEAPRNIKNGQKWVQKCKNWCKKILAPGAKFPRFPTEVD